MKKKAYITEGPLFKSIVTFAIPILVATLVANLFHSADMIILGNMADSVAVASVGATANVIGLVINFFIALPVGTSVVLARAIGAGERGRIKRLVDTSMYFSVAVGFFVALLGNIIAVPVLRALDCPADCFDGAVTYLRIYMWGIPPMLIYAFGGAIIRAEGDSRRPLIYTIASGILNVVLNYVLCLVLTEKVAAVAIATVASQFLSALLVVIRLFVKDGDCKFTFKNPAFSFRELGGLMRFAIPSALCSLMYPLASLQISGALNSYGSAAVAGTAAGTNIEGLTNAFYAAFSTSLVTFMNQNIGAGNRPRVERSMLYCAICSLVLGSIGLFIYLFCPEAVLSLYVPGDAEAIFYGTARMRFVLAFQMVAAMNGILGSSIQAFGKPALSSINSIISILGWRLFWMNFVYPKYQTINCLLFCFSCSWMLNLVINLACFVPLFVKFKRKSVIER